MIGSDKRQRENMRRQKNTAQKTAAAGMQTVQQVQNKVTGTSFKL